MGQRRQIPPQVGDGRHVYARLSVALQRANADGAINWRYAEVGEAVFGSDYDTVHAALNSPPRDLSQCDSDLREEVAVEAEGSGVGGVMFV